MSAPRTLASLSTLLAGAALTAAPAAASRGPCSTCTSTNTSGRSSRSTAARLPAQPRSASRKIARRQRSKRWSLTSSTGNPWRSIPANNSEETSAWVIPLPVIGSGEPAASPSRTMPGRTPARARAPRRAVRIWDTCSEARRRSARPRCSRHQRRNCSSSGRSGERALLSAATSVSRPGRGVT